MDTTDTQTTQTEEQRAPHTRQVPWTGPACCAEDATARQEADGTRYHGAWCPIQPGQRVP